MEPTSNRSWRPRLSEASYLLPLIRCYLETAVPRPYARTLDLVPIVDDGLFGYELIPERNTDLNPILGCNANGEPVLRMIPPGGDTTKTFRLVVVNDDFIARSRRRARSGIRHSDASYPNWLTAADAAWEYLRTLCPDPWRRAQIPADDSPRRLDDALRVACRYLDRWDPLIEFRGLSNEAQLGYELSGADGERGTLIYHAPDTWALRWHAASQRVSESWHPKLETRNLGNDLLGGDPIGDHRPHRRRAVDHRAA